MQPTEFDKLGSPWFSSLLFYADLDYHSKPFEGVRSATFGVERFFLSFYSLSSLISVSVRVSVSVTVRPFECVRSATFEAS